MQQLANIPSRDTTSQSQSEISNLQKQLNMSKDEANKLRDQLNRYSVAMML
jgi:septal ring factor EnvC (AmiA/AmiB activator)